MKKTMKKLGAALLAIAMMIPMATVALADEVDTTGWTSQTSTVVGTGTYADPSDANIWSIELPTAEAVAFTIDPKKLVKASGQYNDLIEADSNSVDDSKGILFTQYGGDDGATPIAVKNVTGELKVVNKGTTNVTVDLNVRLTKTNMTIRNATIATATDKATSIAFAAAAKPATGDPTYTWFGAVGANFTADIDTNPAAFKTEPADEGKYRYVVDDSETGTGAAGFAWNSASFFIQGEANTSAAAPWDTPEETLTAPDLNLTWTIRNKTTEMVEVDVSAIKGAADGNYVLAADCIHAIPGQVVNIYVKPKDKDSTSPKGYYVDKVPGGADGANVKLATKNYITEAVTDDQTKIIACSNGVSAENGATVFTFRVPTKDGLNGFTALKNDNSTANTIVFEAAGAPTIQKVTVSATATGI